MDCPVSFNNTESGYLVYKNLVRASFAMKRDIESELKPGRSKAEALSKKNPFGKSSNMNFLQRKVDGK
jgi:hypothetical protein